MRANSHLLLCGALLCMAQLWLVQIAAASPAYTRQTGADCATCHYMDMRSLNAYGREFLMHSYSETEKMIEDRRKKERQSGHRLSIEHPERQPLESQPLEKFSAHPEDSGKIEEEDEHEALESPEEEALEEQEKGASVER